jgi:hypothetical protein
MPEIALNREVQGRAHTGNHSEQMARILASTKSGLYTATAPTVTVVNSGSNVAITSLDAAFFAPLEQSRANFVEIFSPAAITVRFRTVQNAATATASLRAVNIRANTLRTFDYVADITDIYFSNTSGGNSAVEVTAI